MLTSSSGKPVRSTAEEGLAADVAVELLIFDPLSFSCLFSGSSTSTGLLSIRGRLLFACALSLYGCWLNNLLLSNFGRVGDGLRPGIVNAR